MMFDSTPDLSHEDQMSCILSYVSICGRKAMVNESFLCFFPLKGKTSAAVTEAILVLLGKLQIDVMMCRGLGYDNASTMSGIHSGVQKRIRDINSLAVHVPGLFRAAITL